MNNRGVALITGATRGIGYSTARKFASQGYDLVLSGMQENLLAENARLISETFSVRCLPLPGNLEDIDYSKSLVKNAMDALGRIDILINNAAWRTIETMRTMEIETWEKTIRICLTSPAFLAKWAAAEMEKAHIPGVIVNISSVMAERAAGSSPAYIACKGAMQALTRELAVAYGRSGIRVAGISPGFIETDMSADYTAGDGTNISRRMANELLDFTPLGRPGSPDEIAEAVYWIASKEAAYLTGSFITLDGGLNYNFNSYTIKKLQFPTQF